MDPVTHSLVGAALSRAGLQRLTPRAMVTLVLAANAPDVDIMASAWGSYAVLAMRRGVTHGPLGWLVLPVAVTLIVLAYDRWRRRDNSDAAPARAGPLLLLATIGTLTHSPLDWLNTWGVRLLSPFSDQWFYGDALFIIDPWVWLALGAAVVPLTRTRLGWTAWVVLALGITAVMLSVPEIPRLAAFIFIATCAGLAWWIVQLRRRGEVPGEATARTALVCVALYIGIMVAMDAVEQRVVRRSAEVNGYDVQDLMVAPAPANPFASSIVAQTPASYELGELHWLHDERVRWTGQIARGVRDSTAMATMQSPEVRDFLRWSRYPFFFVMTTPDGRVLRWSDARYPSRHNVDLGDSPHGAGMNGIDVRLDDVTAR